MKLIKFIILSFVGVYLLAFAMAKLVSFVPAPPNMTVASFCLILSALACIPIGFICYSASINFERQKYFPCNSQMEYMLVSYLWSCAIRFAEDKSDMAFLMREFQYWVKHKYGYDTKDYMPNIISHRTWEQAIQYNRKNYSINLTAVTK